MIGKLKTGNRKTTNVDLVFKGAKTDLKTKGLWNKSKGNPAKKTKSETDVY